MLVLRTLLIWFLALSLPLEGMASVAMSHCKDMPSASAAATDSMPAGHDHAAMMAMGSMDDGSGSMDHMNHGQPPDEAASEKDSDASDAGCQCGCDCSGNCAVACAGMMLSLSQSGLSFVGLGSSTSVAMPQGQAHAAYRYDSLRPPSAVAL